MPLCFRVADSPESKLSGVGHGGGTRDGFARGERDEAQARRADRLLRPRGLEAVVLDHELRVLLHSLPASAHARAQTQSKKRNIRKPESVSQWHQSSRSRCGIPTPPEGPKAPRAAACFLAITHLCALSSARFVAAAEVDADVEVVGDDVKALASATRSAFFPPLGPSMEQRVAARRRSAPPRAASRPLPALAQPRPPRTLTLVPRNTICLSLVTPPSLPQQSSKRAPRSRAPFTCAARFDHESIANQ